MSAWWRSCLPDLSPVSVTQLSGGSHGLVSLDTSQSHAGFFASYAITVGEGASFECLLCARQFSRCST